MRLKLRSTIVAALEEVTEKTGMNRKTIINLALYHGMLSIDNGYLPIIKKDCRQENKEIINIDMTVETYNKLQKYLDLVKFEGIKLTQLIETFIGMETLSLGQEYPDYEEEKLKELNIHIKVNSLIKEKVDTLSKCLGISKNQLYMYYFYIGCWECDRKVSPLTVEKDQALVQYIDFLKLDRIKALCLVKAVLYNKYNIKNSQYLNSHDYD